MNSPGTAHCEVPGLLIIVHIIHRPLFLNHHCAEKGVATPFIRLFKFLRRNSCFINFLGSFEFSSS